jgi:hypothetical protein
MTNGNETGGTAGATAPSPQPAQPIISFPELEGKQPAEQLEIMKELFEKASRVKEGAESFLRITPNLSVRAHFTFIPFVPSLYIGVRGVPHIHQP